MLNKIKKVRCPVWLQRETFKFDIDRILKDSLYYPCSGFDGDPIKYFNGNIFSFIYVDYDLSRRKLDSELIQGCRGYHIIHRERINRRELVSRNWEILVEPRGEFTDYYKKGNRRRLAYAEWVIFERNSDFDSEHGAKRFSLLVISDEAVFTYQKLYLQNKVAPLILAMINQGHGYCGNWTDFFDEDKIMYKTVHYYENEGILPQYIVTNNRTQNVKPEWSDYTSLVDKKDKFLNRAGRESYWKYNGKIYIWENEDQMKKTEEDEIDIILRELEKDTTEDLFDFELTEKDAEDDQLDEFSQTEKDAENYIDTILASLDAEDDEIDTFSQTVNIEELVKFYTAKTHQDVITLIEGDADIESRYNIYEGVSYKVYIPKKKGHKKLSLLSAHTDVFFHYVTQKVLVNYEDGKTIITSGDPNVGIGGDCRNGCYLISKIMQSDYWNEYMFAIFDKEEIGSIGARAMPLIPEIEQRCNCFVGLDGFDNNYIAVYPETEAKVKKRLIKLYPENEVIHGFMTDVVVLAKRFKKSSVVLPIGYYRQHTPSEYVIFEDISICLRNVLKILDLF